MNNPWHELPDKPPFVLREDEEKIRDFNAKVDKRYRLRIDEILPEPFVGDPNAPVVILGNNPGFKPARVCYKLERRFVQRLRDNLQHKPSDCPFVFFAPDIDDSHKTWWKKKLNGLLKNGLEYENLSKSIFAVDYFPYPSQEFKRFPCHLPSGAQDYNFQLVRQAIERKAYIVLTRGSKRWRKAVPSLPEYERFCEVRNKQAGTISLANCPQFQEIAQTIEATVG